MTCIYHDIKDKQMTGLLLVYSLTPSSAGPVTLWKWLLGLRLLKELFQAGGKTEDVRKKFHLFCVNMGLNFFSVTWVVIHHTA
jgi:hypothetical protein